MHCEWECSFSPSSRFLKVKAQAEFPLVSTASHSRTTVCSCFHLHWHFYLYCYVSKSKLKIAASAYLLTGSKASLETGERVCIRMVQKLYSQPSWNVVKIQTMFRFSWEKQCRCGQEDLNSCMLLVAIVNHVHHPVFLCNCRSELPRERLMEIVWSHLKSNSTGLWTISKSRPGSEWLCKSA